MFRRCALSGVVAAASLSLAVVAVPAHAAQEPSSPANSSAVQSVIDTGASSNPGLNVATVDTGLTSHRDGDTLSSLKSGEDSKAKQLAKTVKKNKPDILVLTGIDIDEDGAAIDALRSQYLQPLTTHDGVPAYKYVYAPQTNAGQESGADLDGDGTIGGAGDAFGPGDFLGQSSIAVLSRYPIDSNGTRSFSHLAWKDVPGNHLAKSDHPKEIQQDLPLQSTSLWDVPIDVDGSTFHILATAAAARTGKHADRIRNLDQLRFLREYVTGSERLSGVEDDQGRSGPLASDSLGAIAGDLGVDRSSRNAAGSLVADLLPQSDGTAKRESRFSGWLTRLDSLLSNGVGSTRLKDPEGVTGRLDYVIPVGSSQAIKSHTVAAVEGKDFASRMVVTQLDR